MGGEESGNGKTRTVVAAMGSRYLGKLESTQLANVRFLVPSPSIHRHNTRLHPGGMFNVSYRERLLFLSLGTRWREGLTMYSSSTAESYLCKS
jgi:hypothetical protein